ncbi:MAG TPA: insulinase family protein [Kofleriaceae bacterium]|nr:insulinase family protein [Kofleriaceae bacterium]
MQYIRVGLVGVLLAACGQLRKPPDPDRRLNIQQSGTMFESSNGYRFAALPEPGSKAIRVDVRYPVGASDDPPGKEGLAHLVEHMLFEIEFNQGGAKTSINAELGKVALSWNAETSEDFTTYQTIATADHLSQVLGLEVNRIAIGCAGLTPETFAREREVVLNELRTRQGASGAAIQRIVKEAVYPEGHPYRAVDSVETVSKLQLADVCQFISSEYQRGKAVVVVSGGVDGPKLQEAAAKQFVRLRKRIPSIRPVAPIAEAKAGTVKLRADVDEPMFIATWPMPPMDTKDYRLLEIASGVIDTRLEGFAFTYGWGHSSFSTVLGGPRAPVLAVGIDLSSTSKVDDAIDAVKRSVQYSLRTLGSETDSAAWRSVWQGRAEQLLAAWESLGSRNALFTDILSYDHADDYLIGRIAEVQQSSPQALRDLSERWLSPGRARYLVIEPTGAPTPVGGKTFGGGKEELSTAVDGSLADNPLPPPPPRARLSPERYTLDNGLEVILWPYGTTPLVRGRLVIDSGSAHDPVGKEGIAELVGASDVEPDTLTFEERDLSIAVDTLVVRLASELRLPGYGLSDEAKAYIKARLKQPRAAERRNYERDLLVEVYGDSHPYARSAMSEQSIDQLHHDLVNDWARSHIVPKNATLVIAGQFDPELVKKHIAYDVDQVSSGGDSPDVEDTPHSPLARYVIGTAAKPSPTIELDVMFRTVRGIDRDHAKRLVLEQLLDSELAVLRSKHAVTYGFSASYEPRKAGGLWRISGEADATRSEEATKVLLGLLDDMRRDPETYRAAFVLARHKVLESMLLSQTDSLTMVGRLVNIAKFTLAEDFYDRLPDKVSALTLSDFHAFLVKELPANAQVFGAFGNKSAVEAAVTAAKARPAASTKASGAIADPFGH